MREITALLLRELLTCDPETGALHWRERPNDPRWSGRYAGAAALTGTAHAGHKVGHIFGQRVQAQRAIWMILNGDIPEGFVIDHINGDPADNRPTNLRLVSQLENSRNRRRNKNNQSGVTGVRWHKATQRWTAQITDNRKAVHLGSFDTFDEAVRARKDAERSLGYHPNHDRSVEAGDAL